MTVARPFLASLSSPDADALTHMGRRVRFRPGAGVFNEGDTSGRVALVLDGRIKVSSFTEEGREIVLAIRGPGDLLGELSAIDGLPHGSTATVLEPAELLLISSRDFRAYLSEHPDAALLLLEMVAGRLRDADRLRVEFGSLDTVGRLARRLVEMAEEYGQKDDGPAVRIDLALSQTELAGWIGASREAVSKALHSLRSRGWIETRRRGMTVLDLEALRRRAT
jgi:CRP/FNR family transcriptional regulator, cyclic AMP receptor protein